MPEGAVLSKCNLVTAQMFQLGPEHHGEVRLRGRGGGQRQHLLHRQPLAHRRQEGEPRLQQGRSSRAPNF